MARKPAADLFPTEEPWPTDALIGRRQDVGELVAALENGTHRRLAAPRRTGKTSLWEAVIGELEDRGFYTVSLDLWEVADQTELAAALVAKTIANRPALRRLGHSIRELGRETAASVQITTSLTSELGSEVQVAWRPGLADRDPRRYLRYALELPQRVADSDGRRLILFFDEFQNILDLEESGRGRDRAALQKLLRSVLQRSPRVSVLFAGSYEHLMREIFAAEQPLGHFGGYHDLHTISAGAWRQGICARLEAAETTITDAALDLLTGLGEGHPRATMLIAQQAYQVAITAEQSAIGTEQVHLGMAEAQRQERAKHEQVVDRIRAMGGRKTGARAFKLAREIAREGKPYAGSKHAQTTSRALSALQDAGVVQRRQAPPSRQPGWQIIDPLLRRYLAQLDPSE